MFVIVVGVWLLSTIPVQSLGYFAVGLGLIVPLACPAISPILLISSLLFYSTINVPAEWFYALRLYWVFVALTYWILFKRIQIPGGLWIFVGTAGALLCAGLLVGVIRTGEYMSLGRSPILEAALAIVWVSSALVSFAWLSDQGGVLKTSHLCTFGTCWAIAVYYGVAQTVFGLVPTTVPPDNLQHVLGFQQYEELGRRPFTYPTSNGIAVISLMLTPLFLGKGTHFRARWVITVALALLVGVLTLTRSYIFLLLFLLLLRPLLYRDWRYPPFFYVASFVVLVATFSLLVDFEHVLTAFRISGAEVGETRIQIWSFVLDRFDWSVWAFGGGFGTAYWSNLFFEWSSEKLLTSPHLVILEFIGQFGLAGLLFYLGVLGYAFRAFLTLRGSAIGPGVAVALGLVLLREFVATSYLLSPSILALVPWILLGLLFAQEGADQPRYSTAHSTDRPLSLKPETAR